MPELGGYLLYRQKSASIIEAVCKVYSNISNYPALLALSSSTLLCLHHDVDGCTMTKSVG